MMYNIKTGHGGIAKVPNEEIVIVVSSLYRLSELRKVFVFSNRHAYLRTAQFYNELSQLGTVDWTILQQRDFRRDPDDPEKIERYQAEALVYQHVPIDAVMGLVCYTAKVKNHLDQIVKARGLKIAVHVRRGWYF